jgi:NADPH2:quinone reductase
MLAAIVRKFGRIEDIALERVPDPAAGPGQVVVEVAAAGVNVPDRRALLQERRIMGKVVLTMGAWSAGK